MARSGEERPHDTLHRFRFRVDKLSFRASYRVPTGVVSACAQVHIPDSICELGNAPGGEGTPQRGYWETGCVDIPRGSEAHLPVSGVFHMDFVTDVTTLASTISAGASLFVDVLHRDKYTKDQMIGKASVPLMPLLSEMWVQGSARVWAMMMTGTADSAGMEKIHVGDLGILISLEDITPEQVPHDQYSLTQAHSSTPGSNTHDAAALSPIPEDPCEVRSSIDMRRSSPSDAASEHSHHSERMQSDLLGDDTSAASQHRDRLQCPQPHQPKQRHNYDTSTTNRDPLPPHLVTPAIDAGKETAMQAQAVWDFEAWRKDQEVVFEAEMCKREVGRMAVLEGEWATHESRRERELSAAVTQLSTLEDRVQKKLADLEGREARLVAAEEAALKHREELERVHSVRLSEAEAAVRRLQIEFEHQLEIERSRLQEAVRLRSQVDQNLLEAQADARLAKVALEEWKDAQTRCPEAQLQYEVDALKRRVAEEADRASKAVAAKAAFREQAVQLAEQLAEARDEVHRVVTRTLASIQGQAGQNLLQSAASEHSTYVTNQQASLSALFNRLEKLKFSTQRYTDKPQRYSQPSWDLQRDNLESGGCNDQAGDDLMRQSGPFIKDKIVGQEQEAPNVPQPERVVPHSIDKAVGDEASQEVHRLVQERARLLHTSAYSRDDPLIVQITNRINQLQVK